MRMLTAVLCCAALLAACDAPPPRGRPQAAEPARPSAGGEGDPPLPGIVKVDKGLQQQLATALRDKGANYKPRTHHLEADGTPKFTNRLIKESSPYLLQHAHNPVNWYPWGEEAFERARERGVPVLLSIGYSTCHWCHVMERESFEDEEIAAYMNEHFVCIKVDREQRPDLDNVYMSAVNLLTGRGGWPMTTVLTPDAEPFFGGTYFPPRDGVRGARKGFLTILRELTDRYQSDPEGVVSQARTLSQRMRSEAQPRPPAGMPSPELIGRVAAGVERRYDPQWGGFGRAPKFPQPSRLSFLLHHARRTGNRELLGKVLDTLNRMAQGGIYDHVAGGFHRYSTDTRWLVPHFEKMLYDNAQLVPVYLDALAITGDPFYARVARQTLDYVAREMTSPDGGFYSATDADSKGPSGHMEEGYFFTWTPDELKATLGDDGFALVSQAYGVTAAGNFEGRNILWLQGGFKEMASQARLDPTRFGSALDAAHLKLRAERAKRPPPLRDDKILAAWNGLMIGAFARGARALANQSYLNTATRGARFVLRELRQADGRLRRAYPSSGDMAFLDDYAFLTAGLLDLYEAGGDPRFLKDALALQAGLDEHYRTPEGGYFSTAKDHERLLLRESPSYDGALPSGNSVVAENLLRLALITGDNTYRMRAESLFRAFSRALSAGGAPRMLASLDRYYDTPREVVVVSPPGVTPAPALLAPLRSTYMPGSVALVLDSVKAKAQASSVPWLKSKVPLKGKPTAYVCERGRCELPTSDPATLKKQLSKVEPYPK